MSVPVSGRHEAFCRKKNLSGRPDPSPCTVNRFDRTPMSPSHLGDRPLLLEGHAEQIEIPCRKPMLEKAVKTSEIVKTHDRPFELGANSERRMNLLNRNRLSIPQPSSSSRRTKGISARADRDQTNIVIQRSPLRIEVPKLSTFVLPELDPNILRQVFDMLQARTVYGLALHLPSYDVIHTVHQKRLCSGISP